MIGDKEIDPRAAEILGLTNNEAAEPAIPERPDPLEYVARRLSLVETGPMSETRRQITTNFLAGIEPQDLRKPGAVANDMNRLLAEYHEMGQQLVESLPHIPGMESDPEALEQRKMLARLGLNILLARIYNEAHRTDDLIEALNDTLDIADGLEKYAQKFVPELAIKGVYEALDDMLQQVEDTQ